MEMEMEMEMAREHIDKIRKTKFSIDGEANPLIEDLHQAVKNLSAELYAKDVHFLMELIQNAEDNNYSEGVQPSLEFIITSEDITATGAPTTLLIFNNEKGFSSKNIESICSVGRSTKKDNKKRGYIGEKGIGFKSVFLVTTHPYIFSNGYQIRFSEEPCPHCNLGFIVPEWVEKPTLSDIKDIYGSGNTLPTTTIVLPLKPDKVKPVKEQFSSIHPELLLFLSKIKRLSVREHNIDSKLTTMSAIAITSETNFESKKNIDAESYTLHLSAEEKDKGFEKGCSYHMWREKFPVKQANKVERRMEVEELVITLAFPIGERLHRGMSSPGVYAYLPTEMVTNFPFIIQADFLLASSRETILLDNKWNKGILDCVPSAFINALVSLVKTSEDVPVSSLAPMFKFIPVNSSSYQELNIVRESIKAKLVEETIVPSESYTKQKFFHKPREVGRLMPAFWNILEKAKNEGVRLFDLSSHGKPILSSSFDKQEYDDVLIFLGVEEVSNGWYAKCIGSSTLVAGVSEELYLEILIFVAENLGCKFEWTNIKHIPLIKYVDSPGEVSLCAISKQKRVSLSKRNDQVSWLIDWSWEFGCIGNLFFMPKSTQDAIFSSSKREALLQWLKNEVKVSTMDLYDYAVHLNGSLQKDRKLAVTFAHCLYHSLIKLHLSNRQVDSLSSNLPLVDNYGNVSTVRKGVLVPATVSKWVGLIGSNPWRGEGYIELAESYLHPGHFAGESTPGERLLEFLKTRAGVSDIPYIPPPNAAFSAVSAPLTNQNAFLLLDWIRNLKCRGSCPKKFLKCIEEGSWLKTITSGCSGYSPPSKSFMLPSSLGTILQNGSVLVDIPLIDQSFYGERINEYEEELKTIGVMFSYQEACQFIGDHLTSLVISSTLTRVHVLSVLNFIRFLREAFLPVDKFTNIIKEERWLRTSRGCRSPAGSVLFNCEWCAASQISDLPFIDEYYHGGEIRAFEEELKSLGVLAEFCGSYKLVVDNLKSPSMLTNLTSDAVLLILECVRSSGISLSNKIVEALRNVKCFKTNLGYKSPGECFLYSPQWGCILQVFEGFPLLDDKFYGSSIFCYRNELKQMGVKVDFEEAVKEFAQGFKQQASSISKESAMSFLSCCRQLKDTPYEFPSNLKKQKWLRTRLGDYRSPKNCILFGPAWHSISPITLLPFIDDTDNYYGKDIHEYEEELKSMGVITEFKDGVKIVAAGVCFPPDPSQVTPGSALKLLQCIRILLQDVNYSFRDKFWERVSQKWLKTRVGYRPPKECLLFDSIWSSYLEKTDGPFVDEEFYGPCITFYKAELKAIGVTVAVEEGCPLIASQLNFHVEFSTIARIYNYLSKFNWMPHIEAPKRIWIPCGSQRGKWVDRAECVLHDEDGLFNWQLQVLGRHYDKKLLPFLANAFHVRYNPSIDDYCKIWKVWEDSGRPLLHADCCKFWAYVSKHWSAKTQKTLADNLKKLPVGSDSDEILLSNKHDVFMADDLQLKDLFEQSSPQPIFVWYPRENLPSLTRTRLIEIYRRIGVRTISESVQKEESSSMDVTHLTQVNREEILLKKGLLKLILGFLADPARKMEVERRHETIQGLLNATFLETVEPITFKYNLALSSGKTVEAKGSRMIRWDRESSKIFTQKLDRSGGYKNILEYAAYFSDTISEGLLWESSDQISALSGLIKLGFILEFNEEAIGFLMKYKNLQIFKEDEDLLASTFPSD